MTVSVISVINVKPPPCFPCGDSYGYGDVDQDGYVSSKDQNLISQYIAGTAILTPAQKERADVNNDDNINVLDISTIGNFLAGTITTFPVCNRTLRISPTSYTLRVGEATGFKAYYDPDGSGPQAEQNVTCASPRPSWSSDDPGIAVYQFTECL
ncbi:MAG: hypothetical protein COW10_04390, partial [Candidatus Omnitrophica bacterium CG12_big_fil_rev_8_21_14_0_65_42_8]